MDQNQKIFTRYHFKKIIYPQLIKTRPLTGVSTVAFSHHFDYKNELRRSEGAASLRRVYQLTLQFRIRRNENSHVHHQTQVQREPYKIKYKEKNV